MTRTLRDELDLMQASLNNVRAKVDSLTDIEASDYATKMRLRCAAVDLRTNITAATDALMRVCVQVGGMGE